MAEVYGATNGTVALAAATAKTVIEVAAGATVTARIVAASVSFDASAAAAGIKVELVRYATTGTGTAYTPLKYNGEGQARAALCTCKVNDTVEPGTPVVVETYYVPNTAGQFWQIPLGREAYLPSSTLIGLRVTSAAVVNCAANLQWEE
ncbi:hypothetical protein [Terrabacter terrigena]|uniref:Uncharacterized protein n=1 Tax=Terrabacter terrigena TaxID=574718 RepID=A0ABW3MXW8_9MICO